MAEDSAEAAGAIRAVVGLVDLAVAVLVAVVRVETGKKQGLGTRDQGIKDRIVKLRRDLSGSEEKGIV